MSRAERERAAETLRAELAATGAAEWRSRAVETYVGLVDVFEHEAAAEVLAEIVERFGADRELLFATTSELVAGLRAIHSVYALRPVLEVAIGVARTDTPADLARWAAIAVDLVLGWVEDEMEDEAARLIDELYARTQSDRALALRSRRTLAAGLAREGHEDLAITQLRAALDAGGEIADQLAFAADLARLLRDQGERDAARGLLLEWLGRAFERPLAEGDRLAEVHLELAALDHEPEHHARAAVAQAATSEDRDLRHRAACALGEILLAHGALVEADDLLAGLPPLADPGAADALLEDVRRRRGLLPEEPPPDELVDDEPLAGGVEPDLIAFYTWPADPLEIVRRDRFSGDMRVHAWSYGAITCGADLESESIFGPRRSFFCACGRHRGRKFRGIVCPRCRADVVSARVRRWRAGHIRLPRPVLHPWYAPLAASLLDVGVDEALARPGDELREQLAMLDLFAICSELEERLPHAAGRRAAKIGARLAVVGTFRDHMCRPRDLTFDALPVPPPEAEEELFARSRASIRRAFVRLLEDQETPEIAVDALFGCFRRG